MGVLKRDGFTARGYHGFSPWSDSNYPKTLLQINLGYSAIGLMDVINLGVLSNFSRDEFRFSENRDQRYHMEKQPQFTDGVASTAFPGVYAANYAHLDRLKSPLISLPPHQTLKNYINSLLTHVF